MRSCPAAADEAGSIGLVTLAAVAMFAVVAGAGLTAVTDLSAAASRARATADGAALAGAATSPLVRPGALESPDAAARQVAEANGAGFVRSDTGAWPLRYGVTVEVEPRTGWVRRVVGTLRASATGAVRPPVVEDGS